MPAFDCSHEPRRTAPRAVRWLRTLVPWVALTVACSSCRSTGSAVPPPSPQVTVAPRFVGRFDFRDAMGPRFAWTGSTIVARFSGTRLGLRIRDSARPDQPNTYTVIVDDRPPAKVECSRSREDYTLATGLSDEVHQVVIFKNTEASVGHAQLLGLDFGPEGRLVEPPRPLRHRLEVIGDSVSCGYGNEGPDERCAFSSLTENGWFSYGALSARLLDAEPVIVAWSGRGVLRNEDGSTKGTLPELYGLTLPDDPTSATDDVDDSVEVVVINLGANDFKSGVPERDDYVRAYEALVRRVRRRHPHAWILCSLSSTFSDVFPATERRRTVAREYLGAVVASVQQSGDAHVVYFEFDEQRRADGFGCAYHPSLRTHAVMARALVERLRTLL